MITKYPTFLNTLFGGIARYAAATRIASAPSPMTDFCSPLQTSATMFGITQYITNTIGIGLGTAWNWTWNTRVIWPR